MIRELEIYGVKYVLSIWIRRNLNNNVTITFEDLDELEDTKLLDEETDG